MKPLIDISSWQDPNRIDYDRLAAGVRGAILRGAYGLASDTAFERHYRELSARGVPLGIYYFPLDGNVNAQVERFAALVQGRHFALGAWVDVEHPLAPHRLSKSTVDAFIAGAERALHTELGIYTSLYKWREIMADSPQYAGRRLWVANYGAVVPALPRPWKQWCVWQYTDRGRLEGYEGSLDFNRYNEACLASIKPLGAVHTEPEPTKFPFRARVVTPYGLAVRWEPNAQGKFEKWLYYGSTVNVYAIDGDWWRIDPVRSLWSASQYEGEKLLERVDGYQVYLPIVVGPAPTPEPEPEPGPKLPSDDVLFEAEVITTYDYLPIRNKPSTAAPTLGKLYRGDRIKVLEANKDRWYRIGPDQWVYGARCKSLQEPLKSLAYPMEREFPVSQIFGVNPGIYTAARGHNGVDYACWVGTKLIASADGFVETVELYTQYGYGRHVRIRVQGGVLIYGHMREVFVSQGERVKRGQVIGTSDGELGNKYAGFSTGAHLHFEYRIDREPSPLRPGNHSYWAIDTLPMITR